MEILDKKSFEEKVIKSDKKVMVDFYADWCGPCKKLSPILEDLSSEVNDAYFYKINVDDNLELSQEYGIMSIPAVYVFDKGEVYKKSIGFVDKETLKGLLN